MLGNKPN